MISLKYERQNCVHCGREFAKNDDIVVCPVCGTPHHRECWADGNGCGNASRHADGFVYDNPNSSGASGSTEKCPACGNENPDTSLVCHKCGADLTKGGAQSTRGNAQGNTTGGMPFMSFDFTPPNDPYEKSTDTIDDVPVSKIAKRVLVKTEYYVPKFKKMSENKHPFSWNWAACLMPTCIWFYYRKCYLVGTLAAIFDIVLQVLFSGFVTSLTELSTAGYTEQAIAQMQGLIFSPTGLTFLGITLVFRILMGLFGNAVYKMQVISDIKNEKQSVGGVNIIAPVLGYFLFSNITSIIINSI